MRKWKDIYYALRSEYYQRIKYKRKANIKLGSHFRIEGSNLDCRGGGT